MVAARKVGFNAVQADPADGIMPPVVMPLQGPGDASTLKNPTQQALDSWGNRSSAKMPAICYSLDQVSTFFRSVALAVAIQQRTRIEWVEYRESKFINAVYHVLFWQTPPGLAEVRHASRDELSALAEALYERYMQSWLEKVHTSGSLSGMEFVAAMQNLRDDARTSVRELLRDANDINRQIAGEVGEAVKDLATIKLASTVGVASIGAVGALGLAAGSAVMYSGISLGYSATCSLIKDWEKGGDAVAVGVLKEGAKAGVGELAGKLTSGKEVKALDLYHRATKAIDSVDGMVRKFAAQVGDASLSRKRVRKALERMEHARELAIEKRLLAAKAAESAKYWRMAAKAVPVIFAAVDILEGIHDFDETKRLADGRK